MVKMYKQLLIRTYQLALCCPQDSCVGPVPTLGMHRQSNLRTYELALLTLGFMCWPFANLEDV